MFSIEDINRRFYKYVLYFMTYSFIGWLIETTYVSIQKGFLTIRGFLFGPFCPVYGFGAIAVIFVIEKLYKPNLFINFFLGAFVTTLIEYLTAWLLESLYNLKLWDYSTEFLNINGRICLKITIAWGVLSLFINYILHPLLKSIFRRIDEKAARVVASLYLMYILSDTFASVTTLTPIKLIHSIISFIN